MKPTVLFVDDDKDLLRTTEILFQSKYRVKTATTVEKGYNMFTQLKPDAVVVDLNFEGQEDDGLSLLDRILNSKFNTPLVILSNDTNLKRVLSANNRPAEFVIKQGDYEKPLSAAIETAINSAKLRARDRKSTFLTKSPKVLEVLGQIDKIIASDSTSPVLITGESGVGKEHAANYFARGRGKSFLSVNISTLPSNLAESNLFGHKRGAFTGAHNDHVGWIEKADGGVLFLDEIGDCSADIQAKLLRAIQEKQVQPLGSTEIRNVDVQFITATHFDLSKLVEDNEFRHDLHQRLNTFVVKIPPLRERPEDVELLSKVFVSEFSKGKYEISDCGMEVLLKQAWPGNVRELKNVIERAVTMAEKPVLDEKLIQDNLNQTPEKTPLVRDLPDRAAKVMKALQAHGGNRARAAKELDVSKSTLLRWISKFNLDVACPGKPGRPGKTSEVPI